MFKICFIHNLAKVDHFKFIPLGVTHHEPCRHAGSSTSVFLLGRIRKVSSLFLFSVLFIFFYFFIPPYGLPGLVWTLLWVWGLRLGSCQGVKSASQYW